MKSPAVRVLLLGIVIFACIFVLLFRYEYSSQSFQQTRVDRLTGAYEILCPRDQKWRTMDECVPLGVPEYIKKEEAIARANPQAMQAANDYLKQKREQVDSAQQLWEKTSGHYCNMVLKRMAEGQMIYLPDDQSVEPWRRDYGIDETCAERVRQAKLMANSR